MIHDVDKLLFSKEKLCEYLNKYAEELVMLKKCRRNYILWHTYYIFMVFLAPCLCIPIIIYFNLNTWLSKIIIAVIYVGNATILNKLFIAADETLFPEGFITHRYMKSYKARIKRYRNYLSRVSIGFELSPDEFFDVKTEGFFTHDDI